MRPGHRLLASLNQATTTPKTTTTTSKAAPSPSTTSPAFRIHNPFPNFATSSDCSEIYDPVCGTDMVTYANECLMGVARNSTKTAVAIAYRGQCCAAQCSKQWQPVCDSRGVTHEVRLLPTNIIHIFFQIYNVLLSFKSILASEACLKALHQKIALLQKPRFAFKGIKLCFAFLRAFAIFKERLSESLRVRTPKMYNRENRIS
jgi:hypothetical protein